MSRRTLKLAAAVLFITACASQHEGGERLIGPLSYSPAAAGLGCGARLSELLQRRKNAVPAAEDKRARAVTYIDTADSEVFSRLSYRVVGGRVVEIAAYADGVGLYPRLFEEYLGEEIGPPAKVDSYPDPPRMLWRFGTITVTFGEEDGVTVLRTACPFEAGR
jgi:hypothetical protein